MYLNKYNSQKVLKELIQTNLSKQLNLMPKSYRLEQEKAIEFFQKRAFLEECIDKSIEFNKSLNWDKSQKNVFLISNAEELIQVFKLRSTVYTDINYQNEFPDTIEGLNFDLYEETSAVAFCKNNGQVSGTIRLIFDSKNKLPSEEKYSFDSQRKEFNQIGELSRLMVKNNSKGLGLEFKNLFKAMYIVFVNNDIDITYVGIKKEHFKLYDKFGGVEIIKKLDNYGNLDLNALILSWDPSKVSNFFKRSFLK